MNNERLEASITGRVQRVMFRDFTKRSARKLGLVGIVRNDVDGSVRVIAEGPRESLEKLLTNLRNGPLFSDVLHVQHAYSPATNEYASFVITYRNLRDRL